MRTDVALDTEWIKTVMCVSSCNFTKRGRTDSNRIVTTPSLSVSESVVSENAELVKIPQTVTSTKTRDDNVKQLEGTARTDSVTPRLSDQRNNRIIRTRNASREERLSQEITINGSQDQSEITKNQILASHQLKNDGKVDTNVMASSVSIEADVPDHQQTENLPPTTVRDATDEQSYVSERIDSKQLVSYEPQTVNEMYNHSGISISSRPKKETTDKKYNCPSTNYMSMFNNLSDINLSVQQKFYDKWARSKRRKVVVQLDSQSPRKNSEEKLGSRNRKTIPVRISNEQKTSMTPAVSDSADKSPSVSVDTINDDQCGKGDGLYSEDVGECNKTEMYPTAEDRKETIDAIINDIKASLKSLNNDRRSASQSLLQPFVFDVKSEQNKSGTTPSKCRTCGEDNTALLGSGASKLGHQRLKAKALVELGNYHRFPWNRYKTFRYPLKADVCNKGDGTKKEVKIVEKETLQQTKVPMTLSRSTPIFNSESNYTSLDFQNRRIEEHFGKLKNRYKQAGVRDSQENMCQSANYPKLSKTANNSTTNECSLQEQVTSKTSIDTACGANKLVSHVTVRYKVNVSGVKRLPRQDWACALMCQESSLMRPSVVKSDDNSETHPAK